MFEIMKESPPDRVGSFVYNELPQTSIIPSGPGAEQAWPEEAQVYRAGCCRLEEADWSREASCRVLDFLPEAGLLGWPAVALSRVPHCRPEGVLRRAQDCRLAEQAARG